MSKSITAVTIAAISKFAYSQEMKSLGFKRSGNHMYRPSADLFHGVHFQASQWGTSEQGEFTINLVVTSSILYEAWTGKPLPRNPATALFPIQQRIGAIMPKHNDHWWSVSQTTDMKALELEILDTLTSYALPFFADYPDSKALYDRMRQDKQLPGRSSAQVPLIQAILAKNLGHPDEADALIQKALIDTAGKPFNTTVAIIGQRIGVL